MAWAKDVDREQTGILDRTNVNGGAIAIGHPLGASGARIMTTLVNALEQRGGRYGLQTMCEGGGKRNRAPAPLDRGSMLVNWDLGGRNPRGGSDGRNDRMPYVRQGAA